MRQLRCGENRDLLFCLWNDIPLLPEQVRTNTKQSTESVGDSMNYDEKQAFKLDHYRDLAEKNRAASASAYAASSRISDAIPFGQPILVGHHSEAHHRRDIDRIHNSMRKSVELNDKADYYDQKAANIESSTVISSDNPDAVQLLKDKLVKLEAQREAYKEKNRAQRKDKENPLFTPIPKYVFSNLSGNIKSVKDRIQHLERVSALPDVDETINGTRVLTSKEDNRVRLYFDSIPSEEVRTKLKSNGFKWSPYNKAWQRQTSQHSITLARTIAKEART